MCSSGASGGYVAAFIRDPTDNLGTGKLALERLVASEGSRARKAWQGSTVSCNCVPDLLYTSAPPAGDARLQSPGIFALAVESKVNGGNASTVPVSVYCDWDVTLSYPSLEGDAADATGAVRVVKDAYIRQNHFGLWYKDTTGGDEPRTIAPGIQPNVVYRAKSKRFAGLLASDLPAGEALTPNPTAPTSGSFDRFMYATSATPGWTLWLCDYNGKPFTAKGDKNYWILEDGDILTPEPKSFSIGSQYLCHEARSGSSRNINEPQSSQLDSSFENLQFSPDTSKTLQEMLEGLSKKVSTL